jgi:hypothetical protein
MNIGMSKSAAITAAKGEAQKNNLLIAVVDCPFVMDNTEEGTFGYGAIPGVELLFMGGTIVTAVLPNGTETAKHNGKVKSPW